MKVVFRSTHGRGLAVASGTVAIELCSDGQPFEEEELLLFDQDGSGFRGEVLRNKNLDALIFHRLVSRFVGFLSVGIDRYRGVTASAKSSEIVESNRPFPAI